VNRKKRYALWLGCLMMGYFSTMSAQNRYEFKKVYDTIQGISMYTKLVEVLEGDSIRLNQKGEKVQGWIEDYYADGKLLHKGFYKNGKLLVFRNYFPNGICERVLLNPTPLNQSLEVYYETGGQKLVQVFYNHRSRKRSEFYLNGVLKSKEEFDREGKTLLSMETHNEKGIKLEEITVQDAKSGCYVFKGYHDNGKISEEGILKLETYLDKKPAFRKIGIWSSYDLNGENKTTYNTKDLE
jgi:antitoxin component YwqK of YwqJK toxin-antitoxin module